MSRYIFHEPLTEGIILKRPNRFLMEVKIGDGVEICHCPSTGKIANIKFENIPCLLSKSDDPKRRTRYTVEAISLNAPGDVEKYWIGINQNRSNRYVEFLLENNQLPNMVNCHGVFEREKVLGNSKFDFLVCGSYIEVKTPLVMLPLRDCYVTNRNVEYLEKSEFDSKNRFMKHMDGLTKSVKTHGRAIMIILFTFDAERFEVLDEGGIVSKNSKVIRRAVERSLKKGLEIWQVNLTIDKYGVGLSDYFRLWE